jgi:hypothetical protein
MGEAPSGLRKALGDRYRMKREWRSRRSPA